MLGSNPDFSTWGEIVVMSVCQIWNGLNNLCCLVSSSEKATPSSDL